MSLSINTPPELDPLQDVTVLNDENLKFGLPAHALFGGIAFSFGIGIMFRSVWWLAIIFAFVYFTAIYAIHANDPKAISGWTRAVRRAFTWSGGRTKSRRVCYISDGD